MSGNSIDLGGLKSVWYRRPQPSFPHEEITDKVSRDLVTEECKTFVNDVWSSLDCLWLPAPPFMIKQAQLKASQLKVAAALGFELPPTLFTNSPEEFLEFYRQHNGNIVSKPTGASFYRIVGTIFSRYTEVVSKRDVGYAHAVRYCPVIFQAYVPKRVELRITVVGQKVFAAEIHSQETNHTRHDWRRYDHHKTPYFPHELPPEVEQRCVQLVEKLGLCYGAIDMVLTPDGRYVFLEINPNGQYLWIELATGLPISDAICNLLISSSPMSKPAEYLLKSHSGAFQ
jgi:glutathione synthase/RimK-type ligase-like ATP-grasp enzyme